MIFMRTLAHIGIPVKEKPAKATYLPEAKLYITDPADTKNNLEFLFFEAECQMPDIVKTSTHIAYMVDDIEAEINGGFEQASGNFVQTLKNAPA